MAYKKQTHRILSGSLNLVSPGTEIPDSDAQKLENWAYDQGAVIRSRKGHTLDCTSSGEVLQMINAMGSRWQATTSSVHRACGSKIAVANAYIVGFKGFVWAMGSNQRKSDGTNDWRWIPEAPETKATIKTAPEVVTPVDDFTGGWLSTTDADDANPDPSGLLTYTPLGMRVQGSDDTVVAASKDVELNLYDGQDIDDLFKIKLRCKKWSKVAGVTFEVDVGDGSFTNDYYRCRMALKDIRAARKEAITIYIRKRAQAVDVAAKDKFKYGAFERIGQTADKDWRSVVKLRVKVEFLRATRFWFSSWEMIGDQDNTREGDDWKVYYTFTTAAGHESNPSPVSDAIVVNHGSILVSEMEESADPQVTGKNIYLTGGTLGAVYRVNEEPITGTTYTITASDNDLTDLGIQLETDHDDPPEAEGIAGPYHGRILAFKGTRFYWTKQNKPFSFKGPDLLDGDWADIDENAGDIKWMSTRPHEVWIYGENEILILVGDPADVGGEVHPSGVAMGTPSRNGVAEAGGVDYCYLGQGIYRFDGSTLQKISYKVDPIFKGRSVRLWDGTTAAPISDPSSVAVGFEDGVVWVSYDGDKTIKCDLASGRWFSDDRGFSTFLAEGEDGMLGGMPDGKVVRLESGNTDAGAAITLDYLSKAHDCGIQDNEKRFEDVTIYHDTGGAALTATVYYAETGVGVSFPLSSFGRTRTVLQLSDGDGIRARNIAVRINGPASAEVFIYAIDVNFYVEARQAKSYDTAVSDAGSPQVKLIRELHADLENGSAMEVRLETDLPAHGLTERASHTVTTNLFRRTEPIVMSAEWYGHDFRVVCSGEDFRMFGLRALVQIIGTFLHGQKGEYYLSDPIDFGSERVQLWKEIEVVYSSLGGAALKIESTLPTGAFAEISGSPFTLTGTAGQEQTRKVRLPSTAKGRLWRVTLTPEVDFRLEALRRWGKFIGAPNATAWAWADLPLQKTQDAIWVALSFPADEAA